MQKFQEGGLASDPSFLGTSSSLSPWAGPYVTEMLGRGAAVSELPYQAYMGPLTAGPSALQSQAFTGLGSLAMPPAAATGSFTAPGVAEQYMSPYLEGALEPQRAEARRQAEVSRTGIQSRLAKAGAYGGGRQAVMESELDRNLQRTLADITGRGYEQAFQRGADLFGQERGYGLQALDAQLGAGGTQRGIEQAGIAADIGQFEEERAYPYRQTQFMQSLLQGLPISTQQYQYAQPTGLERFTSGAGGILSFLSDDAIKELLGLG